MIVEAETEDELIFEVAYAEEDRGHTSLRNIESCLGAIEGMRRKPWGDGILYQYDNPDTSVGCDFVISHGGSDRPVSLSCELTLPRPTIFALECLPLVVRVARELRMLVEVVSPPYDEKPFVASVEDLMVRWQKANLEEREFQESQGRELFVMPATELEAVWEYALLRRDMVRRYSRARVHVSPVVLWGDKRNHRALRVVSWPRLGSVAFPYSDLVRLESPPAPLQEGAVYSTPQVVQAAGSLLKSLAMPVQHYYFDKEGLLPDLVAIFRSLPRVDTSNFVRLSYGDALDEETGIWE